MFNATFSGPMMSFNTCEVRVAGVRVIGVTKADVDDGLKAEAEYGTGPIALGSAIGQHAATFTMDQHAQEALVLQNKLNALSGGAGYAVAEANVSFTFTGAGVRVSGVVTPVRTVELFNVRFLKFKFPFVNDGKSVVGSWETLVTEPIKVNGLYSINPELFGGSSGISIGIGGEVTAGG